MSDQITLAFSVATAGTPLTPAQAAAALAGVPLYAADGQADPVLGQGFGLTVAEDLVSTSSVTYSGESAPFEAGETVSNGDVTPTTAEAAFDDQRGTLYLVSGTTSGPGFSVGDTLTGQASGATATVVDPAGEGGPTSAVAGATRALTLNMTALTSVPYAPPPLPCRPTGPGRPPPGAPPAPPYVLSETVRDPATGRPVTRASPAALVALYSSSDLDTKGVLTTPAVPAGPGAQVVALSYIDTAGAPYTVYTNLTGRLPAQVALASAYPVAEVLEMFVYASGDFGNSVGQITLSAVKFPLPAVPSGATRADLRAITDLAQRALARPLVYLPPSYFALAQQGASAPALAGDFLVKAGSPTVLTTVDQTAVLQSGDVVRFSSAARAEYTVASVSASAVVLESPYRGPSPAETAPAAERSAPARSVSGAADRAVSAASLVSPSAASPPTSAQLMVPLAEFALAEGTAPALTYSAESDPFVQGETVVGQKSGGTAVVLYDSGAGTLALRSVRSGFVRGETVTGQTSGSTATVVDPRTQVPNSVPTPFSGLYARALSLALGAPITSQPITLLGD